jgi:tetratricopeptide (TPR) repeat protein
MMNPQEEKFLAAMKEAEAGNYSAAEAALQQIIDEDPRGDLADDALYDIGLLQYKQNKFQEAAASFLKVINEYPDATIADFGGSVEHGRTAAKAYLGLINCYLPMGREVDAYALLDKLVEFDADTYVQFTDARGISFRKTYSMLAKDLMDRYAAAKSEVGQGA